MISLGKQHLPTDVLEKIAPTFTGAQLRELRLRLGQTPSELAETLGQAETTLLKWEQVGKRRLGSLDFALRLQLGWLDEISRLAGPGSLPLLGERYADGG